MAVFMLYLISSQIYGDAKCLIKQKYRQEIDDFFFFVNVENTSDVQ